MGVILSDDMAGQKDYTRGQSTLIFTGSGPSPMESQAVAPHGYDLLYAETGSDAEALLPSEAPTSRTEGPWAAGVVGRSKSSPDPFGLTTLQVWRL